MDNLNVSIINETMAGETGSSGPRLTGPMIIDMYNAATARKMIVPIVYVAILMVFGLLGNSLVLYVYGFKWRSSPEKSFIAMLAILDLVNCSITMPTEIATLISFFRFKSAVICKLSRFSTFWMNNASVVVLFSIAVDRFIKICFPNKQAFNNYKAKISCLVSVFVGFLVSTPALVIYGNMTLPLPTPSGYVNATLCNVADGMKNTNHPIGFYIYLWVAFLLIALVMIVLYALIGIKIWKQKSKSDQRKNSLKASLRSDGSSSHTPENQVALVSAKEIKQVENTQSVEISDDCFDCGSSEEKKKEPVVSFTKPDNVEHQTSTTKQRLKSITSIRISKSGLQAGKATAMLFAITMLYILSFLPYLVITIMRTVKGDRWYPSLPPSHQVAVNVFLRSYLISNTGNVVVYGFANLAFRRECVKLFKKIFCCGN